ISEVICLHTYLETAPRSTDLASLPNNKAIFQGTQTVHCSKETHTMLRRFLRSSASEDDGTTANNVAAGRTSVVSEGEASAATATSRVSNTLSTASFLETVTGAMGGHQRATSTGSAGPSTSFKAHEKLKDVVANTMKVEELMNFDACVEAADSQASTSTGRMDPSTALMDPSVLVSAEGEMLIIPHHQHEEFEVSKSSSPETEEQTFQRAAKAFWKNSQVDELGEEYQSAVFLGHDLHHNGDKALNGFSAKGWSPAAASLSLKQTTDAMENLEKCVETLVQCKRSMASTEQKFADKLNAAVVDAPQLKEKQIKSYQKFLKNTFPEEKRLEISSGRVGPLSSSGSTVQVAMVALQMYYAATTELDMEVASSLTHPDGGLTKLQKARGIAEERVKNRQIALQEMLRRSKAMEEQLISCKDEAKRKWDQVHATEMKVTQLVEEKRMERNRLREHQRLQQIKEGVSQDSSAKTSEIWDIVNAATAEMDGFAPMDIPQLPMQRSLSHDSADNKSGDEGSEDLESTQKALEARMEMEEMRYELEEELGLPYLRREAMSAEEAVENVANSLLSVLSNYDTCRRSARLAAETCLVSIGEAQAACIRSIVQMERASINERLQQLEELENAANEIDVRADMRQYIATDKSLPGGPSFLGDDEDGGVASALAVLNDHTDGDMAAEANRERALSRSERSGSEADEDLDDASVTPEFLELSVEVFFQNSPLYLSTSTVNEKKKKALEEFETTVSKLCQVGNDKSNKSRSRRSTICYTINAKRSSHSQIHSQQQFDGLCKVFTAVLNGCATDYRGVTNAKVLMNLSQHFYFQGENSNDDSLPKTYVKNRIMGHRMWEKDEFWDSALNQAVGESLTHSGVMANFERASSKIVTTTNKKRSEWTQTHKTRWHDLSIKERYEAASQVHAVVFAQLGAMSHTMMEFGCGLERTSAFVRRMSIQNRLPMSQRTGLLRHLIQSGKEN
ncbi:MAG: hypothetical protein SGILL_007913, partial [Bacillariaceae sp.]